MNLPAKKPRLFTLTVVDIGAETECERILHIRDVVPGEFSIYESPVTYDDLHRVVELIQKLIDTYPENK